MPYNTTAIPPRREPTGTTQLPLSRVKKMIALDTDISMCSNNATFVITLATEMFIQYMAEQGHNVVKSERKPRRNIQYKDLSSAVSRLDNLEFLTDVVPRTVPFKALKEKKPAATSAITGPLVTNGESSNSQSGMEAGQMTLDGHQPPLVNFTNGFGGHGHGHGRGSVDEGDDGAADPNAQLERESAGVRMSISSAGGIVNGQDVEMGH